jgi:sugar/nucleoside kinase (ribokinase family)
VTACAADWTGRERLERAGGGLREVRSAQTTTFENVYREGRRFDRVLGRADALRPSVLPEADVLLAGPVVGEVDLATLPVPVGAVLGAGLQGWLREIGPDGVVRPRVLADFRAFARCRAVFLSEQDLGEGTEAAVQALRQTVPIVVLTRGARGATVFEGDDVWEIPAVPAREVDPTGAGDVFATAFLLAIASGLRSHEAGSLAAGVAAMVVEAPGARALEEELSGFTR